MARPTKLTPTAEQAILSALRIGNTRTASAEYIGVARETLGQWIRRYPSFRIAVLEAEAQAEHRCTDVLAKEIEAGDAITARWWLERRRHADWGRKEEVAHTGPIGGPVEVVVKEIIIRLPTEDQDANGDSAE